MDIRVDSSLTYRSSCGEECAAGTSYENWIPVEFYPAALKSLQAVIASLRQQNELQLPLTRGDSEKKRTGSFLMSTTPNPSSDTHPHTPNPTHSWTAHISSNSRILLAKKAWAAGHLVNSLNLSVSIVCLDSGTGHWVLQLSSGHPINSLQHVCFTGI